MLFEKLFASLLSNHNNNIDNISICIIVFFIIKNQFPALYRKYNINHYLKRSIYVFYKSCEQNPEPINKVYDLQKYLDVWYFCKLLNIAAPPVNHDVIISVFKSIDYNDPRESLLYWIYIETLKVCDYKKYKFLTKYQPFLIKTIKKNTHIYGYLLTHIVLYDSLFGMRENSQYVRQCMSAEINKYISDNKIDSIDLLSEFIICQHILQIPIHGKIVRNNIQSYHELAVIMLASALV